MVGEVVCAAILEGSEAVLFLVEVVLGFGVAE